MSNQPRRMPPSNSQYYAVPQSPRSQGYHSQYNPSRHPARTPSTASQGGPTAGSRGEMAQEVATGAIGGGYGPYSYNPSSAPGDNAGYNARYSAAPSEISTTTAGEKSTAPLATSSTVPPYMWDTKDPDLDDALHNPDPIRDAALDRSFTLFSARGWANASALILLVGGLLTLFVAYPIIVFFHKSHLSYPGYNYGGINASGQIPNLPGLRTLIDADTPESAYTYTATDGSKFNLIFSDEFNTDGRSFYPDDDPYWEAVDLNYWPTGDLEWYDPAAITTKDGKLVITMTEVNTHQLNWQSGMLQSWNKFCFTTGYIEVSISMPGSPSAPGLWPGAWTMGNLGRAGYGATTEGMWPYSYDSCDLGTFPNQTAKDGTPAAAATGGNAGAPISFLPGQRLSACTCPNSDHPGPSVSDGRGVPEIDILETQIDVATMQGEVSQSYQTAPYDFGYYFTNTTPQTTIYNAEQTSFNTYHGSQYQEAASAVTFISSQNYNDQGYAPYGFEWWSDQKNRDDGYITWFSEGSASWKMTSGSIGPNSITQVSQRLIPEEPMYIVLNLGMSPTFQEQDFKHLTFPVSMYVDYVRVYQDSSVKDGVGCNPSSHPTADYINDHMNAYTNPNLTTWAQAGYSFPKNSKYDGCS